MGSSQSASRSASNLHRLYLARFGTPARVASFMAIGGTGFVVDIAVYLGLQGGLGIEHRLARFVSFWPAVTWNWQLNRALTFADRPSAPPSGNGCTSPSAV